MVPMFDESSLKKIDSEYFNIILMDDRDITIQHTFRLHDKALKEIDGFLKVES